MLSDTDFWQLLREESLPLRPSQYDLASVCNLTCEGGLFCCGDDYLGHKDVTDLQRIKACFAGEGARGVGSGYFARPFPPHPYHRRQPRAGRRSFARATHPGFSPLNPSQGER